MPGRECDDADLLIAGTGSQERALRRRAGSNPRRAISRRRAAGAARPALLPRIALIVPSLAYETFAIVIIEAFSRKTPVVVRDIGPPPEIAPRAAPGSIYRDEAELIETLGQLLASPGLRAGLGGNGYRVFAIVDARGSPRALPRAPPRRRAPRLGCVPWEQAKELSGGAQPDHRTWPLAGPWPP